jgi:hypothetical protein
MLEQYNTVYTRAFMLHFVIVATACLLYSQSVRNHEPFHSNTYIISGHDQIMIPSPMLHGYYSNY